MSSVPDSDATRLHALVVDRIYHEDILLAQRTYNFLMMQAVLAAALTFSSSDGSRRSVAWLIALFGLVLAWLQTAFGRRSHATIGFWRTYLLKIERDNGIKFDSLQNQFFETGAAQLADGSLIKYLGTKPIFETFPWKPKVIPGANVLVGLVIPWLVVSFWLLFIILVLVFDILHGSNTCKYLAVSVIILVTFIFVCIGMQPWPPKGSKLEKNDSSH